VRVGVTGGTGFVGQALVAQLVARGHDVTIFTRRPAPPPPGTRLVTWLTPGDEGWRRALAEQDAVVNLAGHSIAAGRWTRATKRRILASRLLATEAVVAALVPGRTRVLVSGSAVGYYGSAGDTVLTEEAQAGGDFLARVAARWEEAARTAEAKGVRVALLRTGLVLGPGGALPLMARPVRLGLGGPLGSGRQWMAWIHRFDLVRLITWLIDEPAAAGPFNAVAPEPVRNADFMAALGRAVGRPARLGAPAFLLRALLGEMADALLLASQRAIPARALAMGFAFQLGELDAALAEALSAR
jgi:uncharacterized protein (TIGR01777 family)